MLEGDNLVTANTFYIRDDQKSVELYTTSKQVRHRQPAIDNSLKVIMKPSFDLSNMKLM